MKILHCNAPLGARDFARAYIWILWLLALATGPAGDLSLLPASSFEPVGLAALVPAALRPALLSQAGLAGLKLVTMAAIVAAVGGFRRKPASIAACVLLSVHQGVLRGFGHVNHAEIALLFSAYIITWFDYIDYTAGGKLARHMLSRRRMKHAAGAPLTAIALLLCLTYTLTGVHRLMSGGVELFTGNHILGFVDWAQHSPRGYDLTPGRWLFQFTAFRWSMVLGFPLVSLFEILAPLCLVSRRFRIVFCAVMIPFHALVLVTMGILFWQNLALYIFLFDTPFWQRLTPAPRRRAVRAANAQAA